MSAHAPAAPPPRPKVPPALWSVVVFLAVGLCIHLAFCFAYERIVEARTVDGRQKAYFEAFDEPIRVLVIGASHSRGGFDTRQTDDAFTYAFPAEGYPMSYYRMLHVLERHPEVEHVVAPTGPYYFSDRGDPYPEQWIGFREALRFGEAGGDTWGYLKDAIRRYAFPYAGKQQTVWDFLRGGRGGEKTDRNEILRGYQPSYNHMGPGRMHIDTMPLDQFPGGSVWGQTAQTWRDNLDFARKTGIGPTPYSNAPVPTARPEPPPSALVASPSGTVTRSPLGPATPASPTDHGPTTRSRST